MAVSKLASALQKVLQSATIEAGPPALSKAVWEGLQRDLLADLALVLQWHSSALRRAIRDANADAERKRPSKAKINEALGALGFIVEDGVPSRQEVRRKFLTLAKRHHPDRHTHAPAEEQRLHAERFREADEAAKLLSSLARE